MPKYFYLAYDKAGKERYGIVEADSQTLAINDVRGLGLYPRKVNEATKADERRVRKLQHGAKGFNEFYLGGVKLKQLVVTIRQLATLIDAGLPLLRSINVLVVQLKPCKLRDTLREISSDIQGGSTFSESLAKHPKIFDRLFVNMVRAGEVGGMLEVVLSRLADYMERRQALIRRVRGAMVYPIFVILIAIAIVTFLLVRVVPVFAEIFTEFGGALPWPTQFLVDLSAFIQYQWWLILIGVSVFGIVIKIMTKIHTVKRIMDRVVLKVWLLGDLVTKVAVARFARTLGTLVTSGVPILQALKITKDTIGNEVIQNAVQKVHDSIKEGDTIAAPLDEAKVFPAMVVNMIDVGEETGSLDAMLIKVADIYDEEVKAAVEALLSMMEPAIIILLGGVIGFIVIALYMPIFTLGDAISGV